MVGYNRNGLVNMGKNRNASIELLRILLMFGICLLHVCGQGKYESVFPKNVLCCTVVGFIFISGYFGVRFSLSKLVSLYVLAMFYCLVEPLIGGALLWGGYCSAVLDAWRARDGYWFLHAYAILMTLTPLIEKSFCEKESAALIAAVIPFMCVVFCWSYAIGFSHFERLIPRPVGLTNSGSVITMLGIYIAARVFRLSDIGRKLSWKTSLAGIAVIGCVISLTRGYLASYASPFQLVLAALIFCLFSHISIPKWAEQCVLLISPSMFGVYLLHAMIYLPGMDNKVYSLMNSIRDPLIDDGMNRYIAYLFVAILVFAVSLVIDMLRRAALYLVRPKIRMLSQKVDMLPGWIGEQIEKALNRAGQTS